MIRRYLTVMLTVSLTLSALFNPKPGAAYAGRKSPRPTPSPMLAANGSGSETTSGNTAGRISPPSRRSGRTSIPVRNVPQDYQAPEGDYGDAPDGSLAGYEVPNDQVIGRFPTLYRTT